MESTLRIATWNINNGVLDSKADGDLVGRTYIANCLRSINADVVCLQEVPMSRHSPNEFIENISAEANYGYFESLFLSPSHLVDGGMGLAILSRTPLQLERKARFANPNLVTQYNGLAIKSHDKGALCVRTRRDGHDLAVVCLHLIPFHLFGISPSSEELDPVRETLKTLLSKAGMMPTVICGDFNIDSVDDFLPCFTTQFGLSDLIHHATHQKGGRPDHIYHTSHFHDNSVHISESLSDHHLCVADLNLSDDGKSRTAKERTSRKIDDERPVHILHLSDLHFGPGEAEHGDTKLPLRDAVRHTPRMDLAAIIAHELPGTPDFVVVSGDITIKGQADGWKRFIKTFEPLIRAGKLPAADRWVIVPGNHDVKPTSPSTPTPSEHDRWREFVEVLGRRFPRPWIPAVDGDEDEVIRNAESSMADEANLWGGISSSTDRLMFESHVTVLPFVFDRERGVLIYAFNSASISGTTVEIPHDTLQAVESLRSKTSTGKNEELSKLLAEFDRLRQVDAARIDPRELGLFQRLMTSIESREDAGLDGVLKIAVLHHHVAPIYPEEMKPFEPLSNAAAFKTALVERKFQLVLHGHKHWGVPFIDTAIPYGGALLVVSGATIGGTPVTSEHRGFFWLTWHRSRSVLVVKFVQLNQNANAAFQKGEIREFKLDEPFPRVEGTQLHHPARRQRFDLREAFRQAEAALESRIRTCPIPGQARGLIGWSHRLNMTTVSTIATAYGLRILAMTGAERQRLRALIPDILDSLKSVQIGGAEPGWSSSGQGAFAQPEATCWVLDALASHNALPPGAAANLELMLQRGDDQVTLRTTLSVTLIIRTLCRINPRSPWIEKLATLLISAATRDGSGRILCWGRSLTNYRNYPPQGHDLDLAMMEPSVVHTAHALLALAACEKILRPAHLPELEASRKWLHEREWINMEELIQRPKGLATYDQLTVNHFVSPWAILALLQGGGKGYEERLGAATHELWRLRCDDGLWDWNGVERPVWATHDALLALREAALAGIPGQ